MKTKRIHESCGKKDFKHYFIFAKWTFITEFTIHVYKIKKVSKVYYDSF